MIDAPKMAAMSDRVTGRGCPVRPFRPTFRSVHRIPVVVIAGQPWQVAVEHDRTAVAHRRRADPRDMTPEHTSANRRALLCGIQMQFDARSRKHPVAGLDERSLRADVHDNDAFAGTDAGGKDSVFVGAVMSWGSTPVHVRNCHNWFHCLVRTMNFSTRVLPVSPKTRTTYWAFWPRM